MKSSKCLKYNSSIVSIYLNSCLVSGTVRSSSDYEIEGKCIRSVRNQRQWMLTKSFKRAEITVKLGLFENMKRSKYFEKFLSFFSFRPTKTTLKLLETAKYFENYFCFVSTTKNIVSNNPKSNLRETLITHYVCIALAPTVGLCFVISESWINNRGFTWFPRLHMLSSMD